MILLLSKWLIFNHIFIPLGSIRDSLWIWLFAGNTPSLKSENVSKICNVSLIFQILLPRGEGYVSVKKKDISVKVLIDRIV